MTARRKTDSASRVGRCWRVTVLAFALLALTVGCGRKRHRHVAKTPPAPAPPSGGASEPPPAVAPGYFEEGVASWYGIPFNGRAAADGEIYDMETLVAAHRLLPFNTWLRVTNLANGKSVKVRVIDRGPFVNGRILDLSKAAAREIDLLGPGTGKIRLEVISAPPDRPANDFYAVQIGAFAVRSNAEQARSRLAARYGSAYIAPKQGRTPLWRVIVGKESSQESAQALARTLVTESKDVFVVRLDETITAPNTPPGASPSTPAASAPTSASQSQQ
jgi:rare lipoprotein A